MMLTAIALLIPFLSLTVATPVKRASSQQIKSYRTGQCLSPAGGRAAVAAGQVGNGTPLTTIDCASAALWDISPGSGSVILTGTPFALDAGTGPHNNVPAKVWTSYPGLTQQTWYLTDDNRIAITGGNQCLDEGDTGPQTYQCTTGNTNQIWYVSAGTSSPPPSDPNNPPAGTVYPDIAGQGRRIHPHGRNDLCVTVMDATIAQATPVDVAYCFSNTDPNRKYQLWNLAPGFNGQIQLTSPASNGQKFCLFGGTAATNGNQINLDPCGTPYVNLNWTYGANSQLSIDNTGGECMDVRLNSSPGGETPYTSLQMLQTWTCSPGNTQQTFTLYDGA